MSISMTALQRKNLIEFWGIQTFTRIDFQFQVLDSDSRVHKMPCKATNIKMSVACTVICIFLPNFWHKGIMVHYLVRYFLVRLRLTTTTDLTTVSFRRNFNFNLQWQIMWMCCVLCFLWIRQPNQHFTSLLYTVI